MKSLHSLFLLAILSTICPSIIQAQCNAPSNIVATTIGHTWLDLEWTDPTAVEYDSYSVEFRQAGNSTWLPAVSNEVCHQVLVNIFGPPPPIATVYGLEPCTAYEFRVVKTCFSGGSITSNPSTLNASTECSNPYFTPQNFVSGLDACSSIEVVEFEGIADNNTTCTNGDAELGYEFYQNEKAIVNRGEAPLCRVDINGTPGTHFVNAWIDFNQDLDFDDPDEKVFSQNFNLSDFCEGASQQYPVAIPLTAALGDTRMRIVTSYNSDAQYDSGILSQGGRVEDLIVTIQNGVGTGCAAIINTTGSTTVCAGSSVLLNASTDPLNNYQWRKDGMDIPGATDDNYTATTTGDYSLMVTQAGCSAFSSGVTVTVLSSISISNIIPNGLGGSFNLSGGYPQIDGSSYASITMSLQGNPGVTATLLNGPFMNNDMVGFTVPQEGTYTVSVADTGGCSGNGTVVVDTVGGGGSMLGVAPCIEWQRCFGGSDFDEAGDIQQTLDGGFIIAGTTISNDYDITINQGAADIWLVKTDASGNIEWQKTLGGSAGEYISNASIIQVADGGYILAANTYSTDGDVSGSHGGEEFWIVKLNSSGVIQWQNTLGGSSQENDAAIQMCSDGGFILTGSTFSNDGNVSGNHGKFDLWVVKLNASGMLQWQKTFGGSDNDYASNIQQTQDGGYILGATTYSTDGDVSGNHGGSDAWVIKLDASGILQWQKSFGGSSNDFANYIQQTPDGGFIVGGSTFSNDGDVSGNHGGSDMWVIKLDASGTSQWQKTLGGSSDDVTEEILSTSNGKYVMVGATGSDDGDATGHHGNFDVWVVQLDALGSIEWQKTLGGSAQEYSSTIRATIDNGLIIAGATASNDGDVSGNHGINFDLWVVKLKTVSLPTCSSTLLTPVPNSTNVPTTTALNWSKTSGCLDGYHLSLGTMPGGTDLLNNQTVSDTFYQPTQALPPGTTIYVRIIPFNSMGDANGCQEFSFTTAGCNIAIQNIQTTGFTGSFTLFGGLPQTNGSNYSNVTMTLQGNPSVMAALLNAPFTNNEIVNFTAPQEGTYSIIATDAAGCSGTATVTIDTTGTGGNGNIDVAPCIEWQKCFGGSDEDNCYGIRSTLDGGFILAGYTHSNDGDVSGYHGMGDFWVLKLDASGGSQWRKALGGTGLDYFRSIQQTSDGGYIAAGYTTSNDGDVTNNHGDADCWVVKLDATGNIQWQKALGGSSADGSSAILQTQDGGFLMAGWTTSNNGNVTGNHGNGDAWVVKLDASGNLLWQKTYGGSGDDWGNDVQQTQDGGFVLNGWTTSNDSDVSGNHGGRDYWVIKIDAAGNLMWQKALGGTGTDSGSSVGLTADGGFILNGYSASNDGDVTGNHGGVDHWVVKLDASGNLQWQKSFGGSADDYGYGCQQTSDGGYLVSGNTKSNNGDVFGNHGNIDAWVVKTDLSGNLLWQKALGGSEYEYGNVIQVISNNEFISAGNSSSNDGDVSGNHGGADVWVAKTQLPSLPVDCALLLAPVPSSTNVSVSTSLTWNNTDGCLDGYHLSLGTTPGGIDLLNNQAVTDTFYQPLQALPSGTTIYVRIVPFNSLGDASGCQEFSFTTAGCNIAIQNIQTTGLSGSFIISGGQPQINGSNYTTVSMTLQGNPGIMATLANGPFTQNDVVSFMVPQLGTYSITITDANGCSGSGLVVIDTTGTGGNGNGMDVAPCIEWQKCFGGSGSDGANVIRQTSDGDIVFAGSTSSNDGNILINHGSSDSWIVKLNAFGIIQWEKALGGSNSDGAGSMQQTNDGGYVLAGSTFSNDGDVSGNHGYSDFWIVKLDAIGSIQWQKTLGGSFIDNAFSIQQTSDDGFLIAGATASNDGDVFGNHGMGDDFWIVKLTSTGNIQWKKTFGGSSYDAAFSIQKTNDGGFVVVGDAASNDDDVSGNHGGFDMWLIKLSNAGNIEWQKAFGGSGDEVAFAVKQISDGGYILAGQTNSNDGDVSGNHGGNDFCVIKLNAAGNIVWQKTLGGSGEDIPYSVEQISDGGFIVAGNTNSTNGDISGNHGGNDMWVVKLDVAGTMQWQLTLGGSGNDFANSIQQALDGGYFITGATSSNDGDVSGNHGDNDVWVVKLRNASLPACSTLLLSPTPNSNNVPVTTSLSWSTSDGCLDGYHLILSTTPSGSDLLDNQVISDTFYQPQQALPAGTTIYVRIIPFNILGNAVGCQEFNFMTAGGTAMVDVNSIKALIPNVITPDDNGINDTFDPIQVMADNGIFVDESQLFIINRWGEVVHYSTDGHWDGEQHNHVLPQATYYYRLRVVVAGNEYELRGALNLLK